MSSREDYFEERVSRLLRLAEAAQEASGRASDDDLKATYARIADHWLGLARMAVGLGGLSRQVLAPYTGQANRHQNLTN